MAEFAPGIPLHRAIQPFPKIEKPKQLEFGIHHHLSEGAAREHYDLRIGDPETGHAHSWALKYLPKPGEVRLAVQQPTHTVDYMDFKGRIESGYGKGQVNLHQRGKAEIISSSEGHARFNVYDGKDVQEYLLRRTKPDSTDWMIHNVTSSRKTNLPSELPNSKPSYKVVQPEKLDPSKPEEVMQAKIDGAHVLYRFGDTGRQARVYSYRPTERDTGVIEHTQKLPDFHTMKVPKELKQTILRGELYAADDKGQALAPARVGGILNANVWKSREKQKEEGKLKPVVFDVVQWKGQNVEHLPYSQKLPLLEEAIKHAPWLSLPRTAHTPEQKQQLIQDIKTGKEPSTDEGVVVWHKDKPTPSKSKFLKEKDVYVRKIFAEKGEKRQGTMAGGFHFSYTKDGPIVGKVGTGMSHAMKKDMLERPQLYEGLAARILAQRAPEHYAPRAPKFYGFHPDQELPEGIKTASTAWSRQVGAGLKRALGLFSSGNIDAAQKEYVAAKQLAGSLHGMKGRSVLRLPMGNEALLSNVMAGDVVPQGMDLAVMKGVHAGYSGVRSPSSYGTVQQLHTVDAPNRALAETVLPESMRAAHGGTFVHPQHPASYVDVQEHVPFPATDQQSFDLSRRVSQEAAPQIQKQYPTHKLWDITGEGNVRVDERGVPKVVDPRFDPMGVEHHSVRRELGIGPSGEGLMSSAGKDFSGILSKMRSGEATDVSKMAAKKEWLEVKALTTPEERAQAAALERRVFAPNSPYQNPKPPSPKKFTSYGIFDSGQLVATTRVNHQPLKLWEKDDAYEDMKKLHPAVYVEATVVDPNHRGKGLATALQKHVQNEYGSVLLGTGAKSDPAMQHINESRGFKKVLERGKTVQWHWEKKAAAHHDFLAQISDQAKEKGYDIFAVVGDPKAKDGGSIYHNTSPRDSSNAIHHARQMHMRWEKKHGIDPLHDWSKEAKAEWVEKKASELFFLPQSTRPGHLPPLKEKMPSGIWHAGVVHDGKVYETFGNGKHRVSSEEERRSQLEQQKARFVPASVDEEKLHSELTSGTSCGTYAARVVGLSNSQGSRKTLYPGQLYEKVKTAASTVPNVDQTTGLCGPAALKAVLSSHGKDVSEKRLAGLARTNAVGTSGEGLVRAAKELGFDAALKDNSTVAQLKKEVRAGTPPIVNWFSTDEGHYSTVTGVGKDTVTLADPETASRKTMPKEKFERVWFDFKGRTPEGELVRRRMITVHPKAKSEWLEKKAGLYLSVRDAGDKGKGVFADRAFSKGDVVEEAPVVVVPRGQITSKDQLINYAYDWGKQDGLVLGYGSVYNHSDDPNLRYTKDFEKKTMVYTATRDIKKGEELTINYGGKDHYEMKFDGKGGFAFGEKLSEKRAKAEWLEKKAALKTAAVPKIVKDYRRSLQLLTGAEHAFHGTLKKELPEIVASKAIKPLAPGAASPYGLSEAYFGDKLPAYPWFTKGRPGLVVPRDRVLSGSSVEHFGSTVPPRTNKDWLVTPNAVPLQPKDYLVGAKLSPTEGASSRLRTLGEEPFYRALGEVKTHDADKPSDMFANVDFLKSLRQELEKRAFKLQGHTEVQGIPVAIENRKGSVRKGVGKDGKEWRTKMLYPYGYIEGTKGKDGEEIDAYVGPKKDAPNAFVVHQHKEDGTGFDEDKVMLGFKSKEEAQKAYLKHYDDPKFLGPISTVPVERLRDMVEGGKKLEKISAKAEWLEKAAISRLMKEKPTLAEEDLARLPPDLLEVGKPTGPDPSHAYGMFHGTRPDEERYALRQARSDMWGTGVTDLTPEQVKRHEELGRRQTALQARMVGAELHPAMDIDDSRIIHPQDPYEPWRKGEHGIRIGGLGDWGAPAGGKHLLTTLHHEVGEAGALTAGITGPLKPLRGSGHADPAIVLPAESISAFRSPAAQWANDTLRGGPVSMYGKPSPEEFVYRRMRQMGHRPDSPMPLWGRQHNALVAAHRAAYLPTSDLNAAVGASPGSTGASLVQKSVVPSARAAAVATPPSTKVRARALKPLAAHYLGDIYRGIKTLSEPSVSKLGGARTEWLEKTAISFLRSRKELETPQEAKKVLEAGDILVGKIRRPGLLARVSEISQSAPTSHVGMYVGNGRVVHSMPFKGVYNDSLNRFYTDHSFTAYRVNAPKEERDEAAEFARKSVGKGYPMLATLHTLFPDKSKVKSKEHIEAAREAPAFICSALVAAAYPKRTFGGRPIEAVRPLDFVTSTNTKPVAHKAHEEVKVSAASNEVVT